MTSLTEETREQIRNHRDALRALAESDLPVAVHAAALLDAADVDVNPTDPPHTAGDDGRPS